jgi:threonylcarbamoyladenosine tRNA methylthiotransferase MtaB
VSVAKVAFVNLGCRVNRVEVDVIAAELERASCEIVAEADAEAIVINTCAVTGEAEAKTRKAVRHAASLPQRPVVVATGCVANLFEDEISSIASNVVVVRDKSAVAGTVLSELGVRGGAATCEGSDPSAPTPTGRTRPGIKIQDGCDNRCTYCIVWKARGPSRSMDVSEVLGAVGSAVSRGAHEVVLTGINLGRFGGRGPSGDDIELPGLLDLIMRETEVERVRLSSIEPPDVTDELLESMARHGERIAPFLHVCLQSGSDRTLARMGRVYDTSLYRSVVRRAREALPNLALGTDLIVGFPGETDADFDDSLSFCREMDFAKMHVFRYSRRPGTPAATAEGQVDPRVMAERSRRMRELARGMRHAQAASLVGCDDLALVQYPGRAVTGGLFDVRLDPAIPVDSLVRVRLSSVMPDGTLVASAL